MSLRYKAAQEGLEEDVPASFATIFIWKCYKNIHSQPLPAALHPMIGNGHLEDWCLIQIVRGHSILTIWVCFDAGFEEGMKTMRVGGRRRLIVPPDLGPPVGPSTFFSAKQCEVFDVELLNVKTCRRRQVAMFSDVVCE